MTGSRAETNGAAATKVSAPIPARAFKGMNDMSHPSRSLSGRMSVGVQKRSDRVSRDPKRRLGRGVRAGVASNSKLCALIDDKGESLFDTQSDAGNLRVPPPTLRERRHRGLASRRVAVRRRAILVLAVGERPHPRHGDLHDPTDHARQRINCASRPPVD
jgi:hypothetical protein